jgi:hypothetical protein
LTRRAVLSCPARTRACAHVWRRESSGGSPTEIEGGVEGILKLTDGDMHDEIAERFFSETGRPVWQQHDRHSQEQAKLNCRLLGRKQQRGLSTSPLDAVRHDPIDSWRRVVRTIGTERIY